MLLRAAAAAPRRLLGRQFVARLHHGAHARQLERRAAQRELDAARDALPVDRNVGPPDLELLQRDLLHGIVAGEAHLALARKAVGAALEIDGGELAAGGELQVI